MLSLESTDNYEELVRFDERVKKKTGLNKIDYLCEVKIDGLSASLHYQNGKLRRIVTRGDGRTGEDVSVNLPLIQNLPKNLPEKITEGVEMIEIRGEVYLKKEEFRRLNKELKKRKLPLLANPRNAAAGTLRTLIPTQQRNLNFFAYQILGCNNDSISEINNQLNCLEKLASWGFEPSPYYRLCQNLEEIQKYFQEIKKQPFAYKFPASVALSEIKDIQVEITRSGRISYVAQITQVSLLGSKINKATLHNYGFIRELNLNIEQIYQYCLNEDCPERNIKSLALFASKQGMDIKGVSEAIIRKLYQVNLLKTPADFYYLEQKKKELLKVEGSVKAHKLTSLYPNLVSFIQAVEKNELEPISKLLGVETQKEIRFLYHLLCSDQLNAPDAPPVFSIKQVLVAEFSLVFLVLSADKPVGSRCILGFFLFPAHNSKGSIVSIRINPQLYRQLKSEVGRGKISVFIERLIAQELKSQEQSLAQEYQAAAQDKKHIYRVALDPTTGKEIKKTRRCVVISNNQQNYYKRLRGYKGKVSAEILTKVERALGVVLALRREFPHLYDLTQIPTKLLKAELARRGE
ncbi:2832_t:CDS:2 [Entrophospora sp. SA101]|nr:2832_t:CDS:2 [Entrophospora sp. SA101]